jgi:hypothetical protein
VGNDRHPVNPNDYRRSRTIAAVVLLGLVVAGTAANIYYRQEVFSVGFLGGCLTAICLLLGLSVVKIGS